jgi:hypothetical protein
MRTRSQLRFGAWPESPTPAHHATELTLAARRQAESAIAELQRHGVEVQLDKGGRARFRSAKVPSAGARRIIEVKGDLIEAYLQTNPTV